LFFTKFPPRGYRLLISTISKQACVTLQRPPPLTFTLDNNLFDFSRRVTCIPGFNLATFTAQKNPAAPPPITINFLLGSLLIALSSRQKEALYHPKKSAVAGFHSLRVDYYRDWQLAIL